MKQATVTHERGPLRERHVVLQTGFDAGQRFLATWQAWRDGTPRSERLVFLAMESHPCTAGELAEALRDAPRPELARALIAAWPAPSPNLHRLAFDDGRVQLLLRFRPSPRGLREWVARVDAFIGDPVDFDERIAKALGRLAAPGSTLITAGRSPAWHAALNAAGFALGAATPSLAPSDELRATFSPSFPLRPSILRGFAPRCTRRRAVVVGAGLAGCAAAWALAEQGWSSSIFERRASIAAEASGNPAGLFHGVVHAHDGVHARFIRAAALEAKKAVDVAIEHHAVRGEARGLLRLESTLDPAAMTTLLARLGLPPAYVQAVDAAAASAIAGMALAQPAWFYPGGGWVEPGGLSRAFLERAGSDASVQTGIDVHTLRPAPSGWQLLGAAGALIDEAEIVVLANAADATRLLGAAATPMQAVRGQISLLPPAHAHRLPLPNVPIAGGGYLLPRVDSRAVFGSTSQPGDMDGSVRRADHDSNLAQLARLLGAQPDVNVNQLEGRTAWRAVTPDRLPLVGAVPELQCISKPATGGPTRLDQPRFVPRQPGLYVFSGLGSRGITWCSLGAQVLAALVSGAPVPLEADLIDAIDPARFVARGVRRRTRV